MLDDSHIDQNSSGFEKLSADLTKRAQVVAEELKTRVAETEKARRLPVENMERICDEGLLRVIQSRRCGGHELSMRVHLDVLSAIAEGCSATAWVLGVMHAHSWLLAHFPEQAQDDVYGENPNIVNDFDSQIYFNGRKNLIQRCINNLIDNSLKYGKKNCC